MPAQLRTCKFKGDNFLTTQYKRGPVQFDRDRSALEKVVKREGVLSVLEAHNIVVVKACVGVDMSEPRKVQPELKQMLLKRDDIIRLLNQSTLDVINAIKDWRQAMVHAEEFYWGHSNYLLKISTDCWFLNNDQTLKKRFGVGTFLVERLPFLGIYQNTTWDGKDVFFTPKEMVEMNEAVMYILEEETRFGCVIRLHDGKQKSRTVYEPTAHSGSNAVGQGNNMTHMVKTGHPFTGQELASRSVDADMKRGYRVRRPWQEGAITGKTGMHPRNLKQARAGLTKGRPSTTMSSARSNNTRRAMAASQRRPESSAQARSGSSAGTGRSTSGAMTFNTTTVNASSLSGISKNSSRFGSEQRQQQHSHHSEWNGDTLEKRSKWGEFTHTLGRSSLPTAAVSYN
jgi:hypothetical protein